MPDLFFNYSLDCELPARRLPETLACNQAIAVASVTQFVERMADEGMAAGASLFVYPDAARQMPELYVQMVKAGVEIALHLDVRHFSRLKSHRVRWLGGMSREDQREALRIAKEELESVIQQPVIGYRACCASANNDTFPLCEELGFLWCSTSVPGWVRPGSYACWSGAWRYAHHPSATNRLICGSLNLYEVPLTTALRPDLNRSSGLPCDLSIETPFAYGGVDGQGFRSVIEENVAEMQRCDQTVYSLIGAAHNNAPFMPESSLRCRYLNAICREARNAADSTGWRLKPASIDSIRLAGVALNSF